MIKLKKRNSLGLATLNKMRVYKLWEKLYIKKLCFIFLLAVSIPGVAFVPVQIVNLRFSDDANKTRLVLDLTGPTKYHLNQSSNSQLSIDLENTLLAKPLNKNILKNLPIQLVTSEKDTRKKVWRFVFEEKMPLVPKAFILPADKRNKCRFVLDLYKTQVILEAPKKLLAQKKQIPVEKKDNAEIIKFSSKETFSEEQAIDLVPVQPKLPQTSAHSRPIVIVIDPGHGGKDPGAIGPLGNKEKNVVLEISRHLQDMLNKEAGFRAVMTRNSDYFIPLRQRLDIARQYKADMFIAIHADAINNRDAIGASVFALSERGATSEAARWLAEKENQSEMIGVGDLSEKDQLLRSVLIDLSQTHTIAVSLQIGHSVLQSLSKVTNLHYTRVEQAAFVVLKSPDIPSLLVETGYISNPRQEQQLVNSNYQQQIAKAILQGIKSYFLKHPPQGTLLA